MTKLAKMTKSAMIQKLADLGVNVIDPEKLSKTQLVEMIEKTEATKEVDKEETMNKVDTKVEKTEATKEVEKKEKTKEVEKKSTRAEAKTAMIKRVDAWAEKAEVEVKLYKNYPHVRDIKVMGRTVFQLWISANGVRMCTRTSLIPEGVRPEGATIIKDGFDLSIPTFTEVETNLDKYLQVAKSSLLAKKAEAEKKAAENAKAGKEVKAKETKAEKAEK